MAIRWNSVGPEYPHLYEHLNTKYNALYSRSARRLTEIGGSSDGMVAVDIGCGTGISTRVLRDVAGTRGVVIGIDPSWDMLHAAERNTRGFKNVFLFRGEAGDAGYILTQNHMTGYVDLFISNFTYYYTMQNRGRLNHQIYLALRPGGRWAFNITPYLRQIEYDGRVYNQFAPVFVKSVHSVMGYKQYKYKGWSGGDILRTAARQLRDAGFVGVEVEPFELPISPTQAYEFTIDGFYRFGLDPGIPILSRASIPERVAILEEALDRVRNKIYRMGRPTIFNVVAEKPSV